MVSRWIFYIRPHVKSIYWQSDLSFLLLLLLSILIYFYPRVGKSTFADHLNFFIFFYLL